MDADNPSATLRTPRLLLLPAQADLLAGVAAFYRRNAQHLAPWNPPQPPDFASEVVQRARLGKAVDAAAAGTEAHWWLQDPADPARLIGNINLTQIARGPFQNAMLGYAVDAAYEGRGLMREALQTVMAHAFSPALDLHRLQANVRPENGRSVALLHRLGFEQEGLAREYLFIDGDWRDHLMFAVRKAGQAVVERDA